MSSVEDKGTLASAKILRQQLPRYRSATVQTLFTSTKTLHLYGMKDSRSEGTMSVLSLLPAHQRQRWPGDGLTSCAALQASLRVLQDLLFQTKPGIKLHQNAIQIFSCLEKASNMGNFLPLSYVRENLRLFLGLVLILTSLLKTMKEGS